MVCRGVNDIGICHDNQCQRQTMGAQGICNGLWECFYFHCNTRLRTFRDWFNASSSKISSGQNAWFFWPAAQTVYEGGQ